MVGACALALGCASAYQSTYDKTYQQLDEQAEAERRQQEALHAEAQKYVAIVYFATGSAVIDQAGYDEVNWFVKKMEPYPEAILEVRGFTDSTGSEGINQALSDARADAVSAALEMGGISPRASRRWATARTSRRRPTPPSRADATTAASRSPSSRARGAGGPKGAPRSMGTGAPWNRRVREADCPASESTGGARACSRQVCRTPERPLQRNASRPRRTHLETRILARRAAWDRLERGWSQCAAFMSGT